MARITIDIPDTALILAKSPGTLAREAQEALTILWLARGEVTYEQVAAARQNDAKAFWAWIGSMPDVGDGADFERSHETAASGAEARGRSQ
ncbi:MAG: hypothetical protein HYV07_08075 [Deltaproteobacteria bacterium]|nr:hypothetical protein [Deltaproteobacteria bacterium]